MIEKILPGNITRFRIVRAVYNNPGINLSALVRKVKTSPNLVLKYINELSALGVIAEERIGGKKKVHIRNLRSCFDTELSRLIYALIEIDEKLLFFEKYKGLVQCFLQLSEVIGKETEFVLVYGSYARFAATKDSDLDVMFVGNLNKEKISRIREIFITIEPEPSIKIETLKSFLKNKDKPLHQNIIREHIVTYGAINFISALK